MYKNTNKSKNFRLYKNKLLKNKNKNLKKYLYVDNLVNSRELDKHLGQYDINERKIFIGLYSLLVTASKDKNQFTNISSKVFSGFTRKNKAKYNYSYYKNKLVQWGIIAANNKYKNSGNKKEGFTKSFKSLVDYSTHYNIKFYNKFTKPLKLSKKQIKDYSHDPILNYVNNSYKNITTSINNNNFSIDQTNDPIKNSLIFNYIKKLHAGYSNIVKGDHGRLFHTAICGPKEARSFIRWKDNPNNPVIDHDIKTCHPILFLKYINDLEKNSYIKLLNDDIYNHLLTFHKSQSIDVRLFENKKYIGSCPFYKLTRDHMKVEMLRFLNGGTKDGVNQFFKYYFPITYQSLNKNIFKDMAGILQKIESDIMINKLIPFCIKHNIKNIIPMHDGYISDGSYDQDINNFITDHIFDLLNYKITVKSTVLFTIPKKEIKTPSTIINIPIGINKYTLQKNKKNNIMNTIIKDIKKYNKIDSIIHMCSKSDKALVNKEISLKSMKIICDTKNCDDVMSDDSHSFFSIRKKTVI